MLFEKTKNKLRNFRERTYEVGAVSAPSPKVDARTADIFRSKTLLWRKLKALKSTKASLENDNENMSQAIAVRITDEEKSHNQMDMKGRGMESMQMKSTGMDFKEFESFEQVMECHGTYTQIK